MSNWYQDAVKSENEHIRNLVKEYDAAEPKSAKRVEIKNAILVLMGVEENPFNVEEVKEEPKKEETTDFILTAEDIKGFTKKEDLLACIEEINKKAEELENGRLMQSFYQKIELNRKIWAVKRLGFLARTRLREIKVAEKKASKKGLISQKSMKKNKFINLYRQGISFTNITKHPDGVKKEELLEIVDDEVVKVCKTFNRFFLEDWNRWVDKFIKGAK